MKKIVILISGTGSNMLRIVEETQGGILRNLCKVSAVISNREEAEGVRSARVKDIPAITVSSKGKSVEQFEEDLLKQIERWNPDCIVLAGFMKILSPKFVQKFPRRIINIHPADTRAHKGLNGYKWAFENKLEETKITVHYVDESLDGGEIIAQRSVNLNGVRSESEVKKRGLAAEHEFYSKVLRGVLK
jgi:phosphoribosylglycinamide formyltransferase-1